MTPRDRVLDALAPLLWAAVILTLSFDLGSSAETSRLLVPVLHWLMPGASADQIAALHALVRKGAHVTEYAVLAALTFRAATRGLAWGRGPGALLAVVAALAVAALDEGHQRLVLSRTASAWDVGLDTASAVATAGMAWWGWRRAADGLAGALLWLAAGGGVCVIAIDLAASVSPGPLWITTPAAAIVLLLRRRRRVRA